MDDETLRRSTPLSDYRFREFRVRANMVEAIRLYADERIPVGDFLTAVICNDLSGAVGQADDDNLRNLPAIVAYFYNEVPGMCWGSRERMEAWLSPKLAEVERGLCARCGKSHD